MKNFSNTLESLIDSINEIRSMSIGLVHFMNGSTGFLMKDSTETLFHIISIMNMGGVIDEHTEMNSGISKIKLIPKEYGSLQNLINNPIEYVIWLNS